MASDSKVFDVPFPMDGINTDANIHAISPTETPQIANVQMHHGPNQLARRGPYKLDFVDSGLDETYIPVGLAVSGNATLTTWVCNDANVTLFRPYYFRNSSAVPTTRKILARHHDGAGALNAVGNSGYTDDDTNVAGVPGRALMPFQRATYYEDVCYFPSAESVNEATKSGTGVVTVTGARLVRWHGANTANVSTTGTVNVGSTALTTASSGNYLGMFITFDADATTNLPYSYEIIASSGATTHTLGKPYGLGDSPGNKAAANCKLRSRDIPIQSPGAIAVACTHLDRLFVGRCYIPVAVGTVQPGYYSNAIKWCDPFNPEKWNDANLAFVGTGEADFITGLASLGRYLIIFKRTSTWVMAGDSEANFTIRKLFSDVGCIDTRALVETNETIIFPSTRGIFRLNSNLELDELTSNKDGHGIRQSYLDSMSLAGGLTAIINSLSMVTACVDDQNYLHVYAIGYTPFVPANSASYGYSVYSLPNFPVSCYLPNKAWVKFQNPKTSIGLSYAHAASPRFYSCYKVRGTPYGLGPKAGIILDRITSSSTTSYYTGVASAMSISGISSTFNGADEVASTGSTGQLLLYGADVVFVNIEPFKDQTSRFAKFYLQHGIYYLNASTQTTYSLTTISANVDGYTAYLPVTVYGTVMARHPGTPAEARYTTEVVPSIPSHQDAAVGQFFNIRIFDPCDNTSVPNNWRLHRLTIVAEPARPLRAMDHLV